MRVLLDTHAFLWFVAGNPRFSTRARQVIENRDTESLFSIASVWEIAIKVSLGKLALHVPFPAQLSNNGIALLNITASTVRHK